MSAASAWITQYCSRNFVGVVSCSEIRTGNGNREMYLADSPVASITSLTIDTQVIPAQPADGQPGYFLIPSSDVLGSKVLALECYTFCRSRHRNVRVSYTAGWAAVPLEIEQACIELVSSQYKRGSRDPMQDSETSAGQQTLHFRSDLVPTSIKRILDMYQKVVPL